jgi:chemotaxis protein histidine kinase CheA
MPRTARAAAPVEEVVEEAEDFAVYADKNITDTMADFADWIVEEVYGGDENAFRKASSERIVALAGTLRMKFQASDMNIERREQRKLERQSAAPEPEPEAAPAKPARRGRVAAAPEPEAAPAKPARRGRVAAAEAAPAKPARRGRVAAAAAAPY